MQLIKVSVLALLASYVAAQDIDDNDVPVQCRSVCASVISLTQTCDRQDNDNDRNFINCVCTSPNAASEIPACEACVANFDPNDGADNDVNDLIRSCSFSRTSYISMTASPTASVPSSAPNMTASASSTTQSLSATNTASLTGATASPTGASTASANSVTAAGVFCALLLGFIGLV